MEAPDGKAPSCLRGRRSACEVKPTAQGSVSRASAAQGLAQVVCTAFFLPGVTSELASRKTLAREFYVSESNADLDSVNWGVQRRPGTLSRWSQYDNRCKEAP